MWHASRALELIHNAIQQIRTAMNQTHISVGQSLQEVGLATAILANQAVPAANGQLNGAVADELIPLDGHGEARDLDIPADQFVRAR